MLVETVDSRLWTGLVSTRALTSRHRRLLRPYLSKLVGHFNALASLVDLRSVPDLYPSLEAVAFALSGFDGGF